MKSRFEQEDNPRKWMINFWGLCLHAGTRLKFSGRAYMDFGHCVDCLVYDFRGPLSSIARLAEWADSDLDWVQNWGLTSCFLCSQLNSTHCTLLNYSHYSAVLKLLSDRFWSILISLVHYQFWSLISMNLTDIFKIVYLSLKSLILCCINWRWFWNVKVFKQGCFRIFRVP